MPYTRASTCTSPSVNCTTKRQRVTRCTAQVTIQGKVTFHALVGGSVNNEEQRAGPRKCTGTPTGRGSPTKHTGGCRHGSNSKLGALSWHDGINALLLNTSLQQLLQATMNSVSSQLPPTNQVVQGDSDAAAFAVLSADKASIMRH